jgi:hypothetical protein
VSTLCSRYRAGCGRTKTSEAEAAFRRLGRLGDPDQLGN